MKYFLLIGKCTHSHQFELIFGDTLREVVREELEATRDGGEQGYNKLRIVTMQEWTQVEQDKIINSLNNS